MLWQQNNLAMSSMLLFFIYHETLLSNLSAPFEVQALFFSP
jgi:hypothetical protein